MIKIYCANPSSLLSEIKKQIDSNPPKIETWDYSAGTEDFFHTPDQWKKEGKLTASISEKKDYLQLMMKDGVEKKKDRDEVYAVYHGRFIEMIVKHFKGKYIRIELEDIR